MSPNLEGPLIELNLARGVMIFKQKLCLLTAQQKCPLYSFREYCYNSLKEKIWLDKHQSYLKRQVKGL